MGDAAPNPHPERRILRVSELLAGLRMLLEDRVGRVWLVGEISNLHRARSGHSYFTLRDEGGQIRAALFRSAAARVPFEIEDGLEVVVYAEVGVYEARGDLQLVVRQIEPRGQGALQLAFEQLRQRLEREGLFDEARKRALPPYPTCLAVVTSPAGAAIRDVIRVCSERFPSARLVIVPTRVQGEGSEREIAAALASCHRVGAEIALLVRGGGSLEDLWSYNTEVVARAVADCPVPVVSGVGHEVDHSIADFVADARASTPSAAAALAVPDRSFLRTQLLRDWRRLAAACSTTIARARSRLERERDALRALSPEARLALHRARLERLRLGLLREVRIHWERRRSKLALLAARLDSLSPLAVLSRGFALVRRVASGEIVRSAGSLVAGERLRLRLAEGERTVRVEPVGSSEEAEKPL